MSGSYFKPLLGPASHHTSTVRDPVLPDVTSGGDGGEPPTERERVWIIPIAMAVVLIAAIGVGVWLLSQGDESDRESFAAAGVQITDAYSEDVTVEYLGDGRYSLRVADDAALGTVATVYGFDPREAMPSGEGWESYEWAGADAATNDAEFALALSAGPHTWTVTNATVALHASNAAEDLAAGWAQLAEILTVTGQ
jgi:hypothetical protein